MGMMERFGDALRGLNSRASPARPMPSAGYLRDGRNVTLNGFRPTLRAPSQDVQVAWEQAAAQSTYLAQNSGFIAGMIDQAVVNVVGQGLQLNARPDAEALGMSTEAATEWARGVEARFNTWADRAIDCDAEGRKTLGHQQAGWFRSWLLMGEIFCSLPFIDRPGASWRTKVKHIPAHLCVNKSNGQDLVQGVRIDSYGYPKSYLFRTAAQNMGLPQEIEIATRDSEGRSQVIHAFDGMAGQLRGITVLAPVILVARQYGQLGDGTLSASLLQSVFAAVMESEAPTIDTLRALQTPGEQSQVTPLEAWMEATGGWQKNVNIDLNMPGRIAHLFPGQKLTFLENKHPNSQFVDYAEFLLREIARCCGLTYESATGDYSGATYSSVRMATTENFLVTLYRRKNIIAPVLQQIYEAWLEEDIELGNTKFPGGARGYLRNRAAAARAIWRGAGKPQADDLKTAKAHELWSRLGVISHEMICAELGVDYEDIVIALADEKRLRERHGVPEPTRVEDAQAEALIAQSEQEPARAN